ncbi:hypothetical protein NC661_12610 [Aquibacillus koreensis]|uniref:Fur-regulated basic protein FbpA n=1 Tax=Aquibacillus koreensis TaxID=279446 RepID=A0A9X3WLV8_9BACI|nr:hypothetical protein [Aquibacillus koreensis]MCT2537753.1 hypothetical protein [Aquibacillus koreensis]MDC3421213.1 hypothetical protein [Aquibacillus koreensis]
MSYLKEAIEKQRRHLLYALTQKGATLTEDVYQKNLGELVEAYQKMTITKEQDAF